MRQELGPAQRGVDSAGAKSLRQRVAAQRSDKPGETGLLRQCPHRALRRHHKRRGKERPPTEPKRPHRNNSANPTTGRLVSQAVLSGNGRGTQFPEFPALRNRRDSA
jgi:hypothetical protein